MCRRAKRTSPTRSSTQFRREYHFAGGVITSGRPSGGHLSHALNVDVCRVYVARDVVFLTLDVRSQNSENGYSSRGENVCRATCELYTHIARYSRLFIRTVMMVVGRAMQADDRLANWLTTRCVNCSQRARHIWDESMRFTIPSTCRPRGPCVKPI